MLSIEPEKSQVILIGSSEFPRDPQNLLPLPSVRANIKDLREAFNAPDITGISDENIITILDEPKASDVAEILANASEKAQDTLIVYYAGHGLVGQSNLGLYLATRDTTIAKVEYNALSFSLVRQAIADSQAKKKVLILDCCFSGRALDIMGPEESMLQSNLDITGTYVIASAPANQPAIAPKSEKHSAFTGEFLRALREGIDNGKEEINLKDIYDYIRQKLGERALPKPQKANFQDADKLVLSRNRLSPFVSLSKYQVGVIPTVPIFEGRESFLSLLHSFWDDSNKKIAIIAGLGGTGKTSLVAYFARTLLKDHPIAWINASLVVGLETVNQNLGTLAAVSGLDLSGEFEEENKESPKAKLCKCLGGLKNWKCLVVIDDLHLMKEAFLKDVLTIFDRYSIGVKIIAVTRRWNDWFYSLRPNTLLTVHPLPGLDMDSFLALLKYYKIECSADLGEKLWLKTGKGNPKATEIFVGILRSQKNILSLLEVLPDFEETLADQWIQSLFFELSENEKEIARVLSVFQESISASVLESLVGKDSLEFKRALKGLEERFFVSADPNNLKLHDLLKQYCYQNIERPEDIHFEVAQLYMEKASDELSTCKYYEDTLNIRAAEYYIQGHLHLLKAQRWEDAVDVLKKVKAILLNSGQAAIFLDLLSHCSSICDCAEADNWLSLAKAQALHHLGREEEAFPIIEKIENMPDKRLHAECLHLRLNMLLDKKQYEEAKSILADSLPILLQSASRKNSMRILLKAADIFIETQAYAEAENILALLWNKTEARKDEYSLGLIELKSGKLLCLTNRETHGFEVYREAIKRFERIGATDAVARSLKEKGDTENTMGFIEQAKITYNKLLDLYLSSRNFRGYNIISRKIKNL